LIVAVGNGPKRQSFQIIFICYYIRNETETVLDRKLDQNKKAV